MGLLLWFIPLAVIAAIALPGPRSVKHAINIAGSAGLLATGAYATLIVIRDGVLEYQALGGLFYLDAVSILMLDIVLVIGLLVGIYSIGYIENELRSGEMHEKDIRLLYLLVNAFILTMILALTVRNLGVMWIAIEATTLASVFLVGFHNGKPAIEAAWKYILICSVGITVAMLGIIFINSAAAGSLSEAETLDWTVLLARAGELDAPLLRYAFIFILIGFGTKAGLAPMHTWLPDAHSQAPSPVSALLSGVLLNSAMYAIIRTTAIVNKSLGENDFTGILLIAAGLLSVLAAALFILTQRDYKRLLAYSSIEHMGLIALAIGIFTPASLFAGFFHMINHSLTKSMLFLSSGTILQKYGTREIRKVRGLLRALPVTGMVFLIGLIAIGGTPPFGIFASELNILAALFTSGKPLLGALAALLLALVFTGIIFSLFRTMFRSEKDDGTAAPPPGEINKAGAAVLVLLLIGVVLGGLLMPAELKMLLTRAQQIIMGD